MNIKSKALEANLASSRVEVSIDAKYLPLQEVMSRYFGIMEGVTTFLKELSHPYRNWPFIIREARGYALDYFHLLRDHDRGPEAAGLFVDIFDQAIHATQEPEAVDDAVDNLMLLLHKIVKDSGERLPEFSPVLNTAFDRICSYPDETFFRFVRSYYQIKRLAESIIKRCQKEEFDYGTIARLTQRYYRRAYEYWLTVGDPQQWFEAEIGQQVGTESLNGFFDEISHQRMADLLARLDHLSEAQPAATFEFLTALTALPSYNQIVEAYRAIPRRLLAAGEKGAQGHQWKVIFLFKIMNVSGLSLIHEECLREINRTLSWLIDHESFSNVKKLIEKTFSILKSRTHQFPLTALNCALNMGKGVFRTDERDLVNFFIDSVIDLGFQSPMIGGIGDDWQIKVNTSHIQNIRAWLELVQLNPRWSSRLLSGLVIHLAVSGVYIKDTDLFPRDITSLLNSPVDRVYYLIKQLARLLPVFFNDIGAEGDLRDISTRIDEISHRKDVLIHFLRKQSHVESSNRVLLLITAVLQFWVSGDKSGLQALVPPTIFTQISTEGVYFDGVHRAMTALGRNAVKLPGDLLTVEPGQLRTMLSDVDNLSPVDIERVELISAFYKALNQKYNLNAIQINRYIDQLKVEAFPELDHLKTALDEKQPRKKLEQLLSYLATLKTLVLSPETYQVREDIYKKRHFTVDIPSMYGSYHELKFDALGLTLRIESLVNVLFEELIERIDLSLITKATFFRIYDLLHLFGKALEIDGMRPAEFKRQLAFLSHSLEVRGFTFTQYLDIFKGFAKAVKNLINDFFHNIHEQNFDRILRRLPDTEILPKFGPDTNGETDEDRVNRISEIFFRDRIAMSLGLQQLDRFIASILQTLYHQFQKLPKDKINQLLLYDHQRAMFAIDQRGERLPGIIHLGSKGFNLVKLRRFGFPVPPGFIITTEVFRCREIVDQYSPAGRNFKEQVTQHIKAIERDTGKTFGDPSNPLLFSVRSGSSISQPGMMDTFLDVGINEEIAAGLAAKTQYPWFAWDNYRRFLQCYGMAFGLERDHFDAIIRQYRISGTSH